MEPHRADVYPVDACTTCPISKSAEVLVSSQLIILTTINTYPQEFDYKFTVWWSLSLTEANLKYAWAHKLFTSFFVPSFPQGNAILKDCFHVVYCWTQFWQSAWILSNGIILMEAQFSNYLPSKIHVKVCVSHLFIWTDCTHYKLLCSRALSHCDESNHTYMPWGRDWLSPCTIHKLGT